MCLRRAVSAEKLHGTWGYTLDDGITVVTSFEYIEENRGNIGISCIYADQIIVYETGTFIVSTEVDHEIIYKLTHTMDKNDELQENEDPAEVNLRYTYENETLKLTNWDETYKLVKISDDYMTVK